MGLDQQDFEAFEQLVLRLYFETSAPPLTTPFIVYASGIPQRRVERLLGIMLEAGTLAARTTPAGTLEFFVPGSPRPTGAPHAFEHQIVPPTHPEQLASASPVTAVCLSVLVPGAGHIYSGRPGAGMAWMATTLLGYACCFFPGVFLHGLCMLSAAHGPGTARG